MQITFKDPTLADKEAVIEFRNRFAQKYTELHGADELNSFTDGGIAGWFTYITMPKGSNLFSYDKVASSTHLAMVGDKVAGIVNIRYELNEFLQQIGGHIGYSTSPDFEGRGVATVMTQFAIDKLTKKGVHRILITCDANNIGSQRVIIKNGGVLENIITTQKNNKTTHTHRYFINC